MLEVNLIKYSVLMLHIQLIIWQHSYFFAHDSLIKTSTKNIYLTKISRNSDASELQESIRTALLLLYAL